MELNELESVVMELKDKIDGILNTAKEAEDKYKYDQGLEGFKARNHETLAPYIDKLKKLNGDDFDLEKSAYDEYTNDFSDIEEMTYTAQLISEIDSKLAKLKEALDDDHVMVESDGDETKVETHDEVIETNSEEPANEPETEEKPAEDEEEADDDSEEEFVKELEADYAKYHK